MNGFNMRAAVIVFPGSNCDRDMAVALEKITGTKPHMVWHGDSELPAVDLVALPGGFSYGDYLRSGAMAATARIMPAIQRHAARGGKVLAVCNGFQVATECGLLPGALMRNAGLKFLCKDVGLRVENNSTAFSRNYSKGQEIRIPIAHHDGNYVADTDTLKKLEDKNQIVFRYTDNPNGSMHDIAGIINEAGNVIGMMPHPERLIEPALGGTDGRALFESLLAA
jgi:phosphoribosylformylglycinamidine synthase subunit PurQ / glutaminase